MRTYKVKETHLGDKPAPYQPGDTREIEPRDAEALVGLGVLELVEDADAGNTVSAPVVDEARVELERLAEGLTRERDAAQARILEMESERDEAHQGYASGLASVVEQLDAAKATNTQLLDEIAALKAVPPVPPAENADAAGKAGKASASK